MDAETSSEQRDYRRSVVNVTTDQKLDALKRLADFEAAAASESRAKTIDEHNAAFRWLIASLFALNGGAIIAIFGSGKLPSSVISHSVPSFLFGIFLTFAMVIFGQISDREMIKQMHSWGLYWSSVKATGKQNTSCEDEIKQKIGIAEQFGRRGRICGLFSMLSFVVGCILVVLNMAS